MRRRLGDALVTDLITRSWALGRTAELRKLDNFAYKHDRPADSLVDDENKWASKVQLRRTGCYSDANCRGGRCCGSEFINLYSSPVLDAGNEELLRCSRNSWEFRQVGLKWADHAKYLQVGFERALVFELEARDCQYGLALMEAPSDLGPLLKGERFCEPIDI